MYLTLQEIISATGGRLLGGVKDCAAITGISTDTRTIGAGALFIPLDGGNFDGHDYIEQAAENGAICALTERQSAPTDMDIPLIYVNSTRRALMDLADFYRRRHDVKVVAITGSAGKTTTTRMVADILSQKFRTKRTIKNFNNDIGMPLSIFQLEDGDEVLVLEMGMNRAGEVRELSLVGAPDFAVTTYIGDEHMENFQNREGVLRANLEVVDGLRENGTIVLNGDNPLLTGEIAAEKIAAFRALFPSSENIAEAEPVGFQETRCVFEWRGEKVRITVPVPGAHMVMNALLAVVVGLEMGVSPAQITRAFENFTPPDGRMNILQIGGMTVINDVYNANPASMCEAIKVLTRKNKAKPTDSCELSVESRRVAILGDMLELGAFGEARHREVGEFAAEAGVDLLITIGGLSRHTHEGFSRESAVHFEKLEDFAPREFLKSGDTVLIKASRGARFERIFAEDFAAT